MSSSSSSASVKGLIFLDSKSAILHENLHPRIIEGKREPCEMDFVDFDAVQFQLLVDQSSMNIVTVNVRMDSLPLFRKFGSDDILQKVFPGMEKPAPKGFNLSIQFDCDAIVGDKSEFLNKISNLRRYIIGGPYYKAFDALTNKKSTGSTVSVIPFRKNECLFICPSESKVTVIFQLSFADVTDRAIAKVFLLEFCEAQRIVRNAPPVSYSKDTPPELRSVNHPEVPHSAGYISFAIEDRHIKGEVNLEKAVTLMSGFRNYLHYHIKSSKTYLHMRMRKKVAHWLQILNRAKPDAENTEKKTMSGRTFIRK